MEYFLFILFLSPILFFKNKYTYWFSAVVVTAILAFRGSEDEYSRLLPQSYTLVELFNEPALWIFSEKGQFLSLVNGFILQFNLPSQTIFLIYVPLQIGIFAYVTYRLVGLYNIAFFLAMCQSVLFTSMSGLRMGLTASLTLFIIYQLDRKAKVRAIGSCLFSAINHYTAYITPLLWLFLTPRIWFVIVVFVLAIITKLSGILDYIFSLFPSGSLVENYLKSENYTYELYGSDYLKAAQQVIVCCFVALNYKRILSPSVSDRLLFASYVLSTSLLIAFSDFAIFAYRTAAVFSLAEPLIIAKILSFYSYRLSVTRLVAFFVGLSIAYVNYVILSRLQPFQFFVG